MKEKLNKGKRMKESIAKFKKAESAFKEAEKELSAVVGKEIKRLREAKDLDGLNDLTDVLPPSKALRFLYEAIIRLEKEEGVSYVEELQPHNM